MLGTGGFGRARAGAVDAPVELRFVDMFLIVIATLMLVAVVLSITSAFTAGGRIDVAPSITTRSLPAALAGEKYGLRLAVEGGDGTYTWRVVTGTLPEGLHLGGDGSVGGIPDAVGTSQATVEVADGQHRTDSRQFLFTVRRVGAQGPQEKIVPRVVSRVVALPDGTAGTPYAFGFAGELGVPPYRWSVANGEIPAGLQFTDDGRLEGRPEAAGEHSFAVSVADAAGTVTRQTARLMVKEAPPALWQRVLSWLAYVPTALGVLVLLQGVLVYFKGAPPTSGVPSRRTRRQLRRMR